MKKTGIDIIDINGIETKGNLIAIASSAKQGKTTKLIQAMLTSLEQDRNILIASIEHSEEFLLTRLISSYYGIEIERLNDSKGLNSKFENTLYKKLISDFIGMYSNQLTFVNRILINDGLNTDDVENFIKNKNIQDVFIDNYSHSIPTSERQGRQDKHSDMSFTCRLSHIAKIYNVSIFTTLMLTSSAREKDIRDMNISDIYSYGLYKDINYFSYIEVLKQNKKGNIESRFLKSREEVNTIYLYTYDDVKFHCSRFGKMKESYEKIKPVSDNNMVNCLLVF